MGGDTQLEFRELMKCLGERHPCIWCPEGTQHYTCTLPDQPFERLKGREHRIEMTHKGCVCFSTPVKEGRAFVMGTVRLDDDGAQTLVGVTAHLQESRE